MIAVHEACPRCSNKGRKVERVTLENLLLPECHAEISTEQYSVCTTPTCDTVYFSSEASRIFTKSDLNVRFGLKETDAPHYVCYCFDHTTEAIEDEIRRTGQSTVVERIKDSIGREGCQCETTNPLGVCCLRSVQAVVAEAFQTLGIEKDPVGVGEVVETDCFAAVGDTENTMPVSSSNFQNSSPGSRARNDLVADKMTWMIFWGVPIAAFLLAGFLEPTPRTLVSATALFWAGAGCLINASRCGRLHCYFTGPLFVLGGAAILLTGFDIVPIPVSGICMVIAGGVFLAYLPEWIRGNRYLGRVEGGDPANSVAAGCCAGRTKGDEPMVSAKSDCCETENKPTQESSVGDRAGVLAAGGSVVAAILSSACCWLPLLLIGFGASAAGVAGFFEAYRFYLIAGAVSLLGVGFYMVYFRQENCEPGSACVTSNRKLRIFKRGMLWTASVLVTAFVLFPNYVGYVLGSPDSTTVANTGHIASTEYRIEGMTCQGCADRLRGKLASVPGVADVSVDYATKTAVVRYEPGKPVSSEQVLEAVTAAGYKAIISVGPQNRTERNAEK